MRCYSDLAKPVAGDDSNEYSYEQTYKPSLVGFQFVYTSVQSRKPGAHLIKHIAPPFLFILYSALDQR